MFYEKNLNTESSLLPAKAWCPHRSQYICLGARPPFIRSGLFLWPWLLEWWSHFLYTLCEGSRWHLCTSSFWSEHQMALPVDHEETIDTQLLTSRSRTSFPLLELVLLGIIGSKKIYYIICTFFVLRISVEFWSRGYVHLGLRAADPWPVLQIWKLYYVKSHMDGISGLIYFVL